MRIFIFNTVFVENYELKFVNGIIDKDNGGYKKQRSLYLKVSLSKEQERMRVDIYKISLGIL